MEKKGDHTDPKNRVDWFPILMQKYLEGEGGDCTHYIQRENVMVGLNLTRKISYPYCNLPADAGIGKICSARVNR